MFKHILVPVDGSPTAQLAVDKAINLAKAFGSKVTAIFVIDPYPFTGVGTDFAYGQAEYLSAATTEANAAVKAAKAIFEEAGVTVETSVIEAHAAWRACHPGPEATFEQPLRVNDQVKLPLPEHAPEGADFAPQVRPAALSPQVLPGGLGPDDDFVQAGVVFQQRGGRGLGQPAQLRVGVA